MAFNPNPVVQESLNEYKKKLSENLLSNSLFLILIRRLPTFPHLKDAVSSAPVGLTSVFGMGTGVTLPTISPEN